MTSEVVVQERNKTMEIFFNIGWLIWQDGKLSITCHNSKESNRIINRA